MIKLTKVARLITEEYDREEKSTLSPAENIDFTWELSEEIYSIAGLLNAESRLQRHIVNIIRP